MALPLRPALALALAVFAVGLSACTASSKTGGSTTTTVPPYTRYKFDPANFVDPTTSTNVLHPTKPGTQWVRSGTTEVGGRKVPHSAISTMTDVVREIDGVKAVAMLDQSSDSGEIVEVGFDYFALDKDGNVWIMGGYTEDFQGGEFTDAGEAWLGAATGGVPGVLMPGVVRADTQRWAIAAVDASEKPSLGEPVSVGIRTCVAFGCFDNVTVIREGEFKAIDNELKYYAPGIGVIFNDPQLASLHQDSFELVNVVELSPAGLAELSQVVLDLEEHARTTVPDVYGSAARSVRQR
ncbi:MAG: hypothetical protein ABIY48_04500 [Acidimicrobiales bacterium]